MSAITGIYHFNDEPISPEHSSGLMKSLQKYPADNVQTWHKDNVFLGCHAQWITPESIGEQLPFYDYEKQLAITADAIIDNRGELFEKLQVDRTYRKTMKDSELILLSYQKWGEECPKYLVGDFAFMIWDERINKLFGARDYAGSRTLYFYRDQQRFAFSTTIHPLFTLPYIQKKLNEQWLAEYLAIPDMLDTVDASSTVYKHIEQIPPSHTISIIDRKVSIRKFPALIVGETLKLKSNEEYEEAFRDVFQEAVNAKIRTHKNIGAQLSGGLDSGSVVSFAANTLRKENRQINTFSYIPSEDFVDFTPNYRIADERPFIQSIVKHVGNIDDHYLYFNGKSFFTEMDDLIETIEMPYKFLENSFWLKGCYERASEHGVGVLLNGGGGNFTISWGPAIDFYAELLKKLKLLHLYQELHLHSRNTGVKKSKIISVVSKTAFPSIYRIFSQKKSFEAPTLISNEFAFRTDVFTKLKENKIDITSSSVTNAYEARQDWFNKEFYWSAPGTASTKLSLQNALWNRDPTNDLRVIKFCLSVPDEQFVQDGYNRSLVRRATKKYLPDKVRLNQRVRGIQAADWVHRIIPYWNHIMDELEQLAKDSLISEFFNIELLRSLILKFKEAPKSEYAFNFEFRLLMRCLIVYRFMKKLT